MTPHQTAWHPSRIPGLLYSRREETARQFASTLSPLMPVQCLERPTDLRTALAQAPYAILLLDMRAPDAFEILVYTKRQHPDIMIMVIGPAESAPVRQALQRGIQGYLDPQQALDELRDRVWQAVQQQELLQANSQLEQKLLTTQTGSHATTTMHSSVALRLATVTARATAPGDILAALADLLRDHFLAMRSGVYLKDAESENYHPLPFSSKQAKNPPPCVSRDDPATAVLEQQPVLFGQSPSPGGLANPPPPEVLLLMNKQGATYLAPLFVHEELIGWFYLSQPATTAPSPAQLEQDLAQTALLVGSSLESIQQKTAEPLQVPEDNPPPEEEPPRAEASKQTKTPPSEEDSRQFWVDLAASMSHEIRNPLVAIQTFAQLLPDRYDDDDFRKEFSNLVTGEIGKLNQLVEMINDFAHPPEPVYAQTPLGEILNAAVTEAKRQTRRRLTIPIDLPDHLPDLPVNRPALLDTIRHLVVNAIESVRERKTPKVRIQVTPPESNTAEYVTIEISDNGGGIPVEAQPRLYSPFYTTKPRGFGLGLPIARRTMQEHHGHLSVSSSEQGTAIRLALPIHPPSTPIESHDPAKVSTHEKTPDR